MKNTAKVAALAIVLMFGANMAKADGIIVGDRAERGCTTKQSEEGIIVGDREGIIVGDRGVVSSIFAALEGIIVGDRSENSCTKQTEEGIIVGDREGIIVGD